MDLVNGFPEKRKKLVDYYNSMAFEILPEEVVAAAQRCLLDVIACAVGGSRTDSSRIIYEYCRDHFPGHGSQVWADGGSLSPMGAAFVNATMASDLDMDDGNRTALGHPGGSIIPPIVAVGQKVNCSLKDLITAIVVGYDMGVRFGEVLLQITTDRFYGTGTWTVVGGAAGICHIMGYSADTFLSALGVAEAHASISPVMKSIQNGSNTKETMGWAAFSSVIASELARQGFLGVESMLYHREESRMYKGLEDLGKEFRITRSYFKRYTACRWAHAPIEATLYLLQQQKVLPEKIKEISVMTHEKALSLTTVTPSNAIQAEYSIPFTVANILLFGQMGPKQLERENLSDPKVLELAQKIRMVPSPECQDRFPQKSTAIVEIEFLDGRKLRSPITSPRGDFDDPLTPRELEQKYEWLTRDVWNEAQRRSILEVLTRDEIDDALTVHDLFPFQ